MAEDAIPRDALLSQESVRAGVDALEHIHINHVRTMSPEEYDEARQHWRQQVEQVLIAVHDLASSAPIEGGGRAVLGFVDGPGEQVEVSVSFVPQLREVGEDQVEATPAQALALSALEAIQAGAEDE